MGQRKNQARQVARDGVGRFAAQAGLTKTRKGYLRITAGPHRHRYQHRVVTAESCKRFCFWELDPNTGLPYGFHVHHQDWDKAHNCQQNLVLLDAVIHNALTTAWKQLKAAHRFREFLGMIGLTS